MRFVAVVSSTVFTVCALIFGCAIGLPSWAEPAAVTTGTKKSVPVGGTKAGSKSVSVGKSKKCTKINEKTAQAMVDQRPEVKQWRARVEKLGAKQGVTANVVVDRQQGSDYVVHVFELVPDDKETSHTATFNWYYVNKNTGKIRKEF